jgi:uncharacterized membrane protein
MTDAAERFRGVAERAKSVALGLFAYAGIEASVGGIIRFTQGLVSANAQLEQARLNLGGMLWTVQQLYGRMGVGGFNEAVEKGAKLYEDLEKHAAKAVGTTEDYVRALQATLQPIAAAGGGLQEALEVSKLLVPTAQALNIPLEVAAFSIKQALLGMLDARDMLIAQLGLHHEILNQLARQGRQAEVLQMVMEALRRNQDLAAAAGETWGAKLATVQDIFLKIRRTIGEELFKYVKELASEFERWYNANRQNIQEWARLVGSELVNAFNRVVEAVKWLGEHWSEVTWTVKALVEVWIGRKLVDSLLSVISLVGQLRGGLAAVAGAEIGAGAGTAVGTAMQNLKAGVAGAVAGWSVVEAIKTWALAVKEYIGLTEAQRTTAEIAAQVRRYRAQKAFEKLLPVVPREVLGLAEARVIEQWRGGAALKVGDIEQFKQTAKYYEMMLETLTMLGYSVQAANEVVGGFKAPPGGGFIERMHKEVEELMKRKPETVIDMRNSKVEIKMDVRHLDPDRVAAAVLTGLSRAAVRKISARTTTPYSVTG